MEMAPHATEEQRLYANILNKGMLIGLLGLIVTFFLYGGEIMEPQIPLREMPKYFTMPVEQYLEQSGVHAGWAWLGNLGFGDMLNYLPIAFLSGLTIVCYLAIVPGLLKSKDTAYVVIAILEVLVLSVAASGVLGSGGH